MEYNRANSSNYCSTLTNKKPTNWWGRQNAALPKFDQKPLEAAFSAVFRNYDKCRSEVDGDVMSSVAVRNAGMDVRSTFGEYGKQWPNYLTLAGRTRFTLQLDRKALKTLPTDMTGVFFLYDSY